MDIEVYKAMANTNAPLPAVYQNAKQALITCTQLDECKNWADKMSALCSYAKQAGDEELEMLAKKVRAIAMKRCGELLSEIDARGGDHKSEDFKNSTTTVFDLTRSNAGRKAGMTNDQITRSVQIANVPDELFTELVESDEPPSIIQLAELGKKHNGHIPLKNEDAFATAIHFRRSLEELYSEHLEKHEPQYFLDGMEDFQKERAKNITPKIISWLNQFMEAI